MNIDQVHTPQRLEGESQEDYKARRRMSTRLAKRTTLVHASSQGTYFSRGSTSPQKVSAGTKRLRLLGSGKC